MADDLRVAMVTGAARGLGRQIAERLAQLDFHVVITARDAGAARQAATELGNGVSALPVGLDLSDPASVDAAAQAVQVDPGRLDVLVNNAAAYVDWTETATAANLDAARAVMDVNLFGTWRITQALLPLLNHSPAPRVVNVSSGAGSHDDPAFGLRARAGRAASYGISKAALNALTSTLAAELSGSPILVNAVCPGLTATWPGAEAMGARPVADSVPGIVWAVTLPADGPSGGLFRDGQPLAW